MIPLPQLLSESRADEAATVPDRELLRRFRRAGDEAAFELLVYRHGPMVRAVCRRLLGDSASADDAFQATFVALARKADSIRHSVPAWLHRVAVRASLDLLRKPRSIEPLPAVEPIDPGPEPWHAAASAELGQAIDRAIDALPDRYREAFVMCELQGRSLKAACQALGCPSGTVESRSPTGGLSRRSLWPARPQCCRRDFGPWR